MRIRSIKPDFFKDEKIGELKYEERLLFIGLWLIADRDGRLEFRPKYFKVELFPYDDIDIEQALSALEERLLIRCYTVKERLYIDIPNFAKHQKPHHTECGHGLPGFNGCLTVKEPLRNRSLTELSEMNMIHDQGSRNQDQESSLKDSLNTTKGEKIKKIADKEFQELKAAYPKAPQGRTNWKKTRLLLDATLKRDKEFTVEVAIVCVKNYARACRDPQFAKGAQVFFGRDEHWREFIEVSKPVIDYAERQRLEHDRRKLEEAACPMPAEIRAVFRSGELTPLGEIKKPEAK